MSRRAPGFTILEFMEVVIVLCILGGMGAWFRTGIVDATRNHRAIGDTERIAEGVYGWGRGDDGFLGEIGRLPNSPGELVARGSLAQYHNFRGVSHGWRPFGYAGIDLEPVSRDVWDRAFVYPDIATNGGQVICRGADGQTGTGPTMQDDYRAPFVPQFPIGESGSIAVSIFDADGVPINGNAFISLRVTDVNSASGTLIWSSVFSHTWGNLWRTDPVLRPGRHVVEATGVTAAGDSTYDKMRGHTTVWVGPGGFAHANLRMQYYYP